MNDRTLWLILRIVVAAVVLAQGWSRALGGGVESLGGLFDARGVVIGEVLAWVVTVLQMALPILLIAGRYVFPAAVTLCAVHLLIQWLVHAPLGWYLMGAGPNGAEYGVLLIATLLCVGLHYRGSR